MAETSNRSGENLESAPVVASVISKEEVAKATAEYGKKKTELAKRVKRVVEILRQLDIAGLDTLIDDHLDLKNHKIQLQALEESIKVLEKMENDLRGNRNQQETVAKAQEGIGEVISILQGAQHKTKGELFEGLVAAEQVHLQNAGTDPFRNKALRVKVGKDLFPRRAEVQRTLRRNVLKRIGNDTRDSLKELFEHLATLDNERGDLLAKTRDLVESFIALYELILQKKTELYNTPKPEKDVDIDTSDIDAQVAAEFDPRIQELFDQFSTTEEQVGTDEIEAKAHGFEMELSDIRSQLSKLNQERTTRLKELTLEALKDRTREMGLPIVRIELQQEIDGLEARKQNLQRNLLHRATYIHETRTAIVSLGINLDEEHAQDTEVRERITVAIADGQVDLSKSSGLFDDVDGVSDNEESLEYLDTYLGLEEKIYARLVKIRNKYPDADKLEEEDEEEDESPASEGQMDNASEAPANEAVDETSSEEAEPAVEPGPTESEEKDEVSAEEAGPTVETDSTESTETPGEDNPNETKAPGYLKPVAAPAAATESNDVGSDEEDKEGEGEGEEEEGEGEKGDEDKKGPSATPGA